MSDNQKRVASLTHKDKPKSPEHKRKIAASWTTVRRTQQSNIATEINKVENFKLQDFVCSDCGREFKNVTKGVYGGHRRFCVRYRDIYAAWQQWDEMRDGSVAKFAEKHGIHRGTVYEWKKGNANL